MSAWPTARGERLAWVLLALVLPAALALRHGVNANWDLRNYHLYDPHALVSGKLLIDVAPAQLQSFHNPLLDLPFYWLAMSGASLWWASAWLLLPTVASLLFLLRLQRAVASAPPTRLAQVVLVLLALSGAATFSTLASSMNDAFVSAAFLGALVLVLEPEAPGPCRWWLAGLAAGAMAGLKLTAGVYCLGLAAAALAGPGGLARVQRLALLALGGVMGLLLTYGYWGWMLNELYGNPFFPYFNNVFHSPWLPAHSYADARFRADSIGAALKVPFVLLDKSTKFSEIPVRDPRLLLGLASLGALAWRAHRGDPGVAGVARRRMALALFFVASFLPWALQSGIYRYASVLELLACLAMVTWLQQRRHSATWLILCLLFVASVTVRPDWGRASSAAPRFGLQAPALGADAMVIVATREPVGYLAVGLPRTTPVVAVYGNVLAPTECTGLLRRANRRIAAHRGPLWLLAPAGERIGQELLSEHYGLAPAGACLAYPSTLGAGELCPQRRVAPVGACL